MTERPPTERDAAPIEVAFSPEAVEDVLARHTGLSAVDRAHVIRLLLAKRDSQPRMTQASLESAARFAAAVVTEPPDAAGRAPEMAAARAWRERLLGALLALGGDLLTNGVWDLLKLIGERVWLGGDEARTPQRESPSTVAHALAEARAGDRAILRSAVMTNAMIEQWCAGIERDLTAQLQPQLRAARDAAPGAAADELPSVSEREARKLVLTFLGALAIPPESR